VPGVKTKEWEFIGKITLDWVSQSYPSAGVIDTWKYKDRLNTWFEFLGISDSEFVEDYRDVAT